MLASPVAQQVKNLPAMQETQQMRVLSLGQEDPLEKEMATHSSILAWRILGTRDPPPGDLPDPGIKPMSPVSPALQADSLPAEPSGKPIFLWRLHCRRLTDDITDC